MTSDQPEVRDALAGVPEYRAGRPAAADAYKLSSNENPYPPLPGVMAAVVDAAASVNRYPDFASSRLVSALALRHDVPEEQIALGTGSVAVLAQTIQAVAGVGDEVVFPWRSFEAYPILVQLSGATAVRVPLTDAHRLDLTAMAAAVTEATRLLIVCTPNNPTGTSVGRDGLENFLNAVPSRVLVAIDEAYVEFVDPALRLDTLTMVRDRPNVMALRTFSKAYGLAGLRVGYAIAKPSIASALRKTQLPFGVSTIAEQAALASLANEPALLRRVQQLMDERARVVAALSATGVEVPDPQGNFVWLAFGERTSDFAAACESAGIVVRAFAGDGVRVTIGEPVANDRFVDAVTKFR